MNVCVLSSFDRVSDFDSAHVRSKSKISVSVISNLIGTDQIILPSLDVINW